MQIGSDYNASTGYETTTYKMEIPTENISNMFKSVVNANFIISEPITPIKPNIYIQNKNYNHCQMHNHVFPGPPSSISATFYTDIPDHGGELQFYMGSGFNELLKVKPEINKIYMFPGWLFHAPTPQKDSKPRICVNVDYCSLEKARLKDRDRIVW